MSPLNGERPDLQPLFQRQLAIHQALRRSQIDTFLTNPESLKLPAHIKVEAAASPRHPESSQDAFLIDAERNIFMVADGMGGLAAGDVASRVAVATFEEFFQKLVDQAEAYTEADLVATFKAAGQETIARLQVYAAEEGLKELGTTLTLVHLFKDGDEAKLFEATVGDSSAYLVTAGECTKLSFNHILWTQFSHFRADGSFSDPELALLSPRFFSPTEIHTLVKARHTGRLEEVIRQVVAALDECGDEKELARMLSPVLADDTPEMTAIQKFLLLALPGAYRAAHFDLEGYAILLFSTRNNVDALVNDTNTFNFRHSLRTLDSTRSHAVTLLTDGGTDPLTASLVGETLTSDSSILDQVNAVNTPDQDGKYPKRAKFDDVTRVTVEIKT
ncbi:MAG TPA: protein phosphatase 2C domain-containing protein [Patescibacteria group bacterium]